jgi:hypothetical protein
MICKFIKKLFGLDKKPNPDLQWLEDKVKESEDKLENIENEEVTIDDVNDHFNK